MSGDDKAFAICGVAFLLGIGGGLITPWALPCAAVAIVAIALSKPEEES